MEEGVALGAEIDFDGRHRIQRNFCAECGEQGHVSVSSGGGGERQGTARARQNGKGE